MTIGANMLSLLALGAQRSLLNRGAGQITLAEWHASSSRVAELTTLEIGLFVLTAVVFMRWLHRCYVNLAALDVREPRFTPGWAVGYWFVPLLNLVRPKQILDELWRATDRAAPRSDGASWRALPTTSLTSIWWAALFLAGIASRLAVSAGSGTIGELKSTNGWLMLSHLAELAAAALVYRLVSRLTARQESCAYDPAAN